MGANDEFFFFSLERGRLHRQPDRASKVRQASGVDGLSREVGRLDPLVHQQSRAEHDQRLHVRRHQVPRAVLRRMSGEHVTLFKLRLISI